MAIRSARNVEKQKKKNRRAIPAQRSRASRATRWASAAA